MVDNEMKLRKVRANSEGIKPIFSNDYVLVHTETEFYMTFLVVDPPAIIDEIDQEEFEKNPTVPSEAVAKIVMTPKQMKQLLVSSMENLEKYENKFGILEIEE